MTPENQALLAKIKASNGLDLTEPTPLAEYLVPTLREQIAEEFKRFASSTFLRQRGVGTARGAKK